LYFTDAFLRASDNENILGQPDHAISGGIGIIGKPIIFEAS
jgi:hypothetical protein